MVRGPHAPTPPRWYDRIAGELEDAEEGLTPTSIHASEGEPPRFFFVSAHARYYAMATFLVVVLLIWKATYY